MNVLVPLLWQILQLAYALQFCTHLLQYLLYLLHISLTEDFDAACELFKEVQKRDPYSLEHMDTYSNILYVKVWQLHLKYFLPT